MLFDVLISHHVLFNSYMVVFCSFFFFKQKTAYEMRISDWSSDVCSSDLSMRTSRPVILRPAGTGLVCACTDATAASRSGASSRWRFDRPHRDGRVRDTKSGTVGWVEPTAKPIV